MATAGNSDVKTFHFLCFILITTINTCALLAETVIQDFNAARTRTTLESSCLLFADSGNIDSDLANVFLELSDIFSSDAHVSVGTLDLLNFHWSTKGGDRDLHWIDRLHSHNSPSENIGFFPKTKIDRACLLSPSHEKWAPSARQYAGPVTVSALVEYLNSQCGAFRTETGDMSIMGLHRHDILDNLFKIDNKSCPDMQHLYSSPHNPLKKRLFLNAQRSIAESQSENDFCDKSGECGKNEKHQTDKYSHIELGKCDTITLPLSKEEFFEDYLKKSKPVIIKGATKEWAAFNKWTNEFFREQFGEREVHVKLTPGGDFEGVEEATLWEDYKTFNIPDAVRSKLQFPDLVMVRPAPVNMLFNEFMDVITQQAQQASRNVSAYLEYSSIPEYMSELEEDISEFDFIKLLLKLEHLNLWLSDGHTLGRLHFDQYDNLLCQLRGRKEVILFEPYNNSQLYEGHIQQATYHYNRSTHHFRRRTLEDSTSMVMSPIDIRNPNLERFKEFGGVQPLNCTLDEGDVLFMPSFWWHEVYSWPNKEERRNLAVNFWYTPFLTREFPCPECQLDINPYYYHLLERLP